MHGMRNGLHRWFPVGLISRGPRDVGKGEIASFDIIRARRIHCLKRDGTLEKPSGGGWLPCHPTLPEPESSAAPGRERRFMRPCATASSVAS